MLYLQGPWVNEALPSILDLLHSQGWLRLRGRGWDDDLGARLALRTTISHSSALAMPPGDGGKRKEGNKDEEGGVMSKDGPEHFEPGDLVWAKVHGFPWWPGQMMPEALADERHLKARRRGNLVSFFGDNSFGRHGSDASCSLHRDCSRAPPIEA